MTDLTIYDLIGEDHEICVKLVTDKHINIEIKNDQDERVYFESSHIYAWESLVSFAKQVLACDERLRQEIEIND